MTGDVHVVAVGARTPLGLTAEASMAAVRAGISALGEHPTIVDGAAEPVRMACDALLDPKRMGAERLVEMVASAVDEAARGVEPQRTGVTAIPLMLALPEARPGWTGEHVRAVSEGVAASRLPLRFASVTLFPFGHAAGLVALDAACATLRAGRAELVMVAGADSYLDLDTLDWLDDNRQLATSYHRGAFFPGEGAGAFVVASGEAVRRHGLRSLAVVRETATATETKLIKTDAVCLGQGLTECVRQATAPLRLPAEAVDGIVCDINGERYRSEEWGFTFLRFPHTFVDPTGYHLPASCWGDVGAASGPLFVAMAVGAGRKGWAKGPRYLLWCSSEGGARAAAVLELGSNGDGGRG